jgi:hypothetical protein
VGDLDEFAQMVPEDPDEIIRAMEGLYGGLEDEIGERYDDVTHLPANIGELTMFRNPYGYSGTVETAARLRDELERYNYIRQDLTHEQREWLENERMRAGSMIENFSPEQLPEYLKEDMIKFADDQYQTIKEGLEEDIKRYRLLVEGIPMSLSSEEEMREHEQHALEHPGVAASRSLEQSPMVKALVNRRAKVAVKTFPKAMQIRSNLMYNKIRKLNRKPTKVRKHAKKPAKKQRQRMARR